MFLVHTTKRMKSFPSTLRLRNLKTQQSQATETVECAHEHAHSKDLVESTWLTALLFPPSFPAILDLCLRKTQADKSPDRDVIILEKLGLQNTFYPH